MSDLQRVDRTRSKALLKEYIKKQMPEPGEYQTVLPGVRTYRRDQTTQPTNCFYRPVIVKMVQGRKQVTMGSDVYLYGEDEVLVTGVDMPGVSMVCEASPEAPSMSIVIDLDKNLLAQLALEIPHKPLDAGGIVKGIHVQPVDADLLDAFLRLTELLSSPEKMAILGPMIVREIHYHLLTGPDGDRLRSFHTLGSQGTQVALAISWLKQNLATSIQIEQLAEKVHMAPSTFHRHFKEVTTLSPLQYQKQLRLHEAQRLMLTEDLDASHASFAVGYDSLSQFSREYKRFFGDPPGKDVRRVREAVLHTRHAHAGRPAPSGIPFSEEGPRAGAPHF